MNNDDSHVTGILRTVFGYKNFKNDIQKEATIAISKGSKYVCISMPPGFGRSLCFELPAILQEGQVAIVLSPRLCSMKKRVDFLRNKQINAHLLSSFTKFKDRNKILTDLTSNCLTIPLLYATTQVAIMSYFQKLVLSLIERNLLSYIVFNEAHCLSEWGYEYTPFYKDINSYIDICGNVPIVAVTTTVTDKVIEDICELLTMESPKIFKMPVQQINVFYDVWFLDILSQPFEHLTNFITEVLGFLNPSISKIHRKLGIVYCKEKVIAELIETKLIASGVPTLVCHHKLNKKKRSDIEHKWISGKANLIITTYDYGFIHRKPIKCIVYWTVPENIPKYYRESAQCHIDDGSAYCRIYFSTKEYSSVKMLIERRTTMYDLKDIKIQLNEYNKLVSYCLLKQCRHSIISEYFGHVRQPCRRNCDFCENSDTVEHRTDLFISYSENIHKIKYSICDINADMKKKQSTIIQDKPKEYTENALKKCNSIFKSICIDKNNRSVIAQYRDQKGSLSDTELYTEDNIQTKKESTMKRAEDNSNATQIAHALLVKYNLNKEISLKPCSSNRDARINNILVPSKKSKSQCDSRIKEKNSATRIRTVEKEGQIANPSPRTVIFTGAKEPRIKRDHRCVTVDTNSTEFRLKRRKIETENKVTSAVQVKKEKKGTSARNKRNKDDESKKMSRDDATVEYLFNKFKLDRDSISLIPFKK
ncbi:ATP-dependent DNA helicase Q5 [Nomia melanderi]|uniref:ATP-dependent DNA helicase Q5 n=1 Tax=Nomia melanderi TaxID=2448451 RepID=UPI0013044B13|nr:ATP-dependent DNA helicase Q5-like [Nomia melanderi]